MITRIDEDGDLVKLCPQCKEEWPATSEFFYSSARGLHSWCKACYQEKRNAHRRANPGCTTYHAKDHATPTLRQAQGVS